MFPYIFTAIYVVLAFLAWAFIRATQRVDRCTIPMRKEVNQ